VQNRDFREMATSPDPWKQVARYEPSTTGRHLKSRGRRAFDMQENLPSTKDPASDRVLPTPPDNLVGEKVVQQGAVSKIERDEQIKERSPLTLLESLQADVVDSLHSGMRAWFGFYLMTGEGTGQERLSTASTGLRKAADRLRELADRLQELAERLRSAEGTRRADAYMKTYREAVDGWATAMHMIAEGVQSDNQSAAREGLSILVEASVTAKLVVRGPLYPNLVPNKGRAKRVFPVGDALAYLLAVSPPRRVAKTALRHAKQPWEQAIIAAGSPLRRL
jgi:hypothetical protein